MKRKVVVAPAPESRGGGLGLVAADRVSSGEPLLAVPFALCLSAESCRRDPLVGGYADGFDGWTGAAGLIALQLMAERHRGAASGFAPWLALLPAAGEVRLPVFATTAAERTASSLSNPLRRLPLPCAWAIKAGALDLPLFWPEADRAALADCSTRPIAELGKEVEEDFDWLEANVFSQDRAAFPAASFGQPQWRECVGLAVSRSFFVSGESGNGLGAIRTTGYPGGYSPLDA